MAVKDETELLTYEQWLLLPETTQPCEVIDGALRMSPSPIADHQWVLQNISDALSPYVRRQRLGVVLLAPMDIIIERAPLRTRQPDLLFLSAARTGIRGRKELIELQRIEVPPDLVVEVLSGGSSRESILDKIQDYISIGVRECWLVSPEAETVEVLRLTPEGAVRTGLYGIGDSVRSEVLPDFELRVVDVFA